MSAFRRGSLLTAIRMTPYRLLYRYKRFGEATPFVDYDEYRRRNHIRNVSTNLNVVIMLKSGNL